MILPSRSFFEPVLPTEKSRNHYFAGVHDRAREWIRQAQVELAQRDQAAASPGSP